ncbi:hypothetical protein JOQ06_005339, partial [Pogonophryne albipinna]
MATLHTHINTSIIEDLWLSGGGGVCFSRLSVRLPLCSTRTQSKKLDEKSRSPSGVLAPRRAFPEHEAAIPVFLELAEYNLYTENGTYSISLPLFPAMP